MLLSKLNEKLKTRDDLIKKMKKNIDILKSRNLISEDIKMQLGVQKKQMLEMENEANLIKLEFFKLQEANMNKDGIINEFQNLSHITKDKFKMFEEANKQLREENDLLRRKLDEYENKLLPQMNQLDKQKENQIYDFYLFGAIIISVAIIIILFLYFKYMNNCNSL